MKAGRALSASGLLARPWALTRGGTRRAADGDDRRGSGRRDGRCRRGVGRAETAEPIQFQAVHGVIEPAAFELDLLGSLEHIEQGHQSPGHPRSSDHLLLTQPRVKKLERVAQGRHRAASVDIVGKRRPQKETQAGKAAVGLLIGLGLGDGGLNLAVGLLPGAGQLAPSAK